MYLWLLLLIVFFSFNNLRQQYYNLPALDHQIINVSRAAWWRRYQTFLTNEVNNFLILTQSWKWFTTQRPYFKHDHSITVNITFFGILSTINGLIKRECIAMVTYCVLHKYLLVELYTYQCFHVNMMYYFMCLHVNYVVNCMFRCRMWFVCIILSQLSTSGAVQRNGICSGLLRS